MGKTLKGNKYTQKDEMFDKKQLKKTMKNMKTAGVSIAITKAKKEQGYSKKPKVKPSKKGKGFIS